MTPMKTIACVIGTRPEAIKMAPVIRELQASDWARCVVVATAQHRNLLDQMLSGFQVDVNQDLDLMTPAQSASELLSKMLPALDRFFEQERVNAVLAQGDTITVLGASLTAFHKQIPFGHVEAGLRTKDLSQPFPEEGYRQIVSRLSRWHFTPTEQAGRNLIDEGISSDIIHLTGNTVIDSLLGALEILGPAPAPTRLTILVTAHRRESFGPPLHNIFQAVLQIVERHTDVDIIYPVHPNPEVHSAAYEQLGAHPRIRLLPPQGYFEFVELMRGSTLILTDSGGIQEEAPALGKPVLVLRDRTERPEAIDAGVAMLVGTDVQTIVNAVTRLLEDPQAYSAMSKGASPYGDGRAAERITKAIKYSLL